MDGELFYFFKMCIRDSAFIKGVEENGYTTEKVYVNYQNIKPCLGCNVSLIFSVCKISKSNNSSVGVQASCSSYKAVSCFIRQPD